MALRAIDFIKEDLCNRPSYDYDAADVFKCTTSSQSPLHPDTDVNRTRPMVDLVIERFPVMKEEIGFRREVMHVPTSAMKNLVTTSLSYNSSHDCRALVKAALTCRREIASTRNDNNHKFTIEEHGFKEQ